MQDNGRLIRSMGRFWRGLRLSLAVSGVVFLGATHAAYAAPSACPQNYYQGEAPEVINEALLTKTRELCASHHAIFYSGLTRTPLWTGIYLTQERIAAGRDVPRTDVFREDTRLPKDWQARLSDYRGSGYDRGHLVPSASMPTKKTDAQSFFLSNIIPQDQTLNRSLWAAIESGVRAHANYRPIYVITGVLFKGQSIKLVNGRVMVPTHLYKVIYEPDRNLAGAYLVENTNRKRHQELSLEEIEALAGVRFFPGAKDVGKLKLPRPRYPRG